MWVCCCLFFKGGAHLKEHESPTFTQSQIGKVGRHLWRSYKLPNQNRVNYPKLLRTVPSWVWKCWKMDTPQTRWATCSSLLILRVRKLFLTFTLYFLSLNLCPLLLLLFNGLHKESRSVFPPPLSIWAQRDDPAWAFFYPGWIVLALSASPHMSDASVPQSPLPAAGPTPTCLCLPYTGASSELDVAAQMCRTNVE